MVKLGHVIQFTLGFCRKRNFKLPAFERKQSCRRHFYFAVGQNSQYATVKWPVRYTHQL